MLEGAYRIERLVGEGGMGAVYEAAHLRLGTRVAVKVMARELAANPEALARFHREALVTSGLGHPHIVKVLDFSTTPSGEPFLAMEFLEGEDLEHRLRRVRRLPIADVVHIIKQVASALAATHAKAIVHRDLKPGNIFLLTAAGENDFVKVLDFGISKVRSASTKLTRTSSVMGTPAYMSPEQARGHIEDIDERTDQWALACIVWECLSGEGPFWGENVPSILFQIVHEPPPALAPKVAGLPSQVEEVLLRALAKAKNDRFANVSDFALALERAGGAAVSTVVGRPEMPAQTAQLPDPAPAKPTTFTQTAGELDDLGGCASAAEMDLGSGRRRGAGPAAGRISAVPCWASREDRGCQPAAPVAPAPPASPLPAPPPQAEPPAAPPPSVPEIKPESPTASTESQGRNFPSGARGEAGEKEAAAGQERPQQGGSGQMAHRRVVLVVTVLAAVGANLPQFHSTALAAGLDQKGEADAKQATRLYKQGQYEEAAQIFSRLSVDYPDMEIFDRNLGACFYHLRKPEPALSNLRRYLGRRKDIAPDDKAVVDRWIDEMEQLRAQNAAASAPPAPPPACPPSQRRRHPRLPRRRRPHRLRRPQGPPSLPRQPQRRPARCLGAERSPEARGSRSCD